MHILAFESWPTLLAGGQERSLFEVICGLRDRGVRVTLAYEKEGELLPEYERRGVHTVRVRCRILHWRTWRLFPATLCFVVAILKLVMQGRRGDRWTLIYLNQYFDAPVAAICATLLRIPVVCHLRLAAPAYLSRQFRWGLRRCKLLICNSEYTAKTYLEAGFPKHSIAVVHNAIDVRTFAPASDLATLAARTERLVLYVGRISPEKGIEVLLRAAASAKAQDPRIRLLIVGSARGHGATTMYVDDLRKQAHARLGDAVEFREATADVACLYRTVDLTVLPSIWDEPFGRVVIESMACGVPCIASSGGGVPEILVGDLEVLQFRKGDSAELCSRILTFVDWRVKQPELGASCRRRVIQSFAVESAHKSLFALLESASGAVVRAASTGG